MAENKGRRGTEPAKPESDSKPAKRAYGERARERAEEVERSRQDAARGADKRRNVRKERE